MACSTSSITNDEVSFKTPSESVTHCICQVDFKHQGTYLQKYLSDLSVTLMGHVFFFCVFKRVTEVTWHL